MTDETPDKRPDTRHRPGRDRPVKARPAYPADKDLEKLMAGFAAPIAGLASDLAERLAVVVRTLVDTAYVQGRADMLEEIRVAERDRIPLRSIHMSDQGPVFMQTQPPPAGVSAAAMRALTQVQRGQVKG